MRGLILESTRDPMLAYAGKARMLAALLGHLERCVYEVKSPKLPRLRNAASLIITFGAFVTIYKSTLRHFMHAKYSSNSYVRHVDTKLSKIVGNFWNSIISTMIALCMGVAA